MAEKDKPWLFRTYAGHSTAEKSNALYRSNLAKGQTGLSVAFDLPTQTGYDSDHVLARGEVGKVGVPVCHLGDMRALFDQIPLEQMNTSMTINATAAWLLALYVAVAEEQGADVAKLQGTVQNDIIKEYLSRGTYVFPPAPSLKLIADGMTATFPALYEGDRFVVADLIKTDFGLCWRLADVEADLIKRRGKRFIPWAKGSTSRIQKTLGLHECRARFPVETEVESRCASVGSPVMFVPVKASVQPLSKEVQE